MNQLIERTLDQLVAAIEGEALDWRKTWAGGGLPMNHTTGKNYRGINILLLWSAASEHQFPTQRWATYKQWAAAGHQVGKGERSSTIFISKDVEKKDRLTGETERYRLLRCAFVFNSAQLVEPLPLEAMVPVTIEERHDACAALVLATGANVLVEPQPCYRPSKDTIYLPEIGQFISADAYYATLFHELVHWTGHHGRTDRAPRLKGKDYAFEELVAEFGAAFLCAQHGITEFPDHDNHAAYMQNWLKRVGDDKAGALLLAAGMAGKAVEFIQACGESKQEAAA